MIEFLIKSSLCLGIFLGFYLLVLEREKIHQFNRLYLLVAIIISLVLPFITFEIIKIVPAVQEIEPTLTQTIPNSFETPTPETIDYTILLWSIYGLTTLILFLRFGKNIWKLVSKSNTNPTVKYQNATLVLVDDKTLPHTFLNTIFINSEDYNQRNIEDELYTHELVHVSQKHTLDILFIEFLKVIFWFNPIFIFYKKAIQLNHEFLADEKVVKSYKDVPFYQNLLLQKSTGYQTIYLASNLNYLVTKKRLIMMTKSTSKRIALLKKIAVAPILVGLIFFICFKIVAQEKATVAKPMQTLMSTTDNKKKDVYYAGVRIIVNDIPRKVKIDKIYEDLTPEEKKRYINHVAAPYEKKSPSEKELSDFKNSKKYAIWIDDVYSPNSKLNSFKPHDIAYYSGSIILKNARSKAFPQLYQYHFYTNDYFDKNLKNAHLKFGGDTLRIAGVTYADAVKKLKKTKTVKADTLVGYNHEKKENEIYNTPALTEKPEFEGGMVEFYKYIASNYKVPEEVNKNKLKGKVFASFIVEKDGSLSNIKVLKDMGYGTGEEAERILKNAPKWKPGKINEKTVRTLYTLPISITSN